MTTLANKPDSGKTQATPTISQSSAFTLWVDRHFGTLMMMPGFLLLVILGVFPTLFLLYLSLSRWDSGSGGIVFQGLGNFVRLFTTDTTFLKALWLSVKFTIIAVMVEYALGLALAVALNRDLPGLGVIRTLMVLPMAMTPVVVGFAWKIMLDPTLGLLNYVMQAVGLPSVAFLGGPETAFYSVVAVDIWQWTPFMFLMLSAGVLSLPKEVLEAASVDGASGWQLFWRVVFPMLRNISLLALLIRALDVWKVFDTVYVMTRGGPGTATTTLNVLCYIQGFQWFNLGYSAAIAVILLLISTIAAQLVLRSQSQLLEIE